MYDPPQPRRRTHACVVHQHTAPVLITRQAQKSPKESLRHTAASPAWLNRGQPSKQTMMTMLRLFTRVLSVPPNHRRDFLAGVPPPPDCRFFPLPFPLDPLIELELVLARPSFARPPLPCPPLLDGSTERDALRPLARSSSFLVKWLISPRHASTSLSSRILSAFCAAHTRSSRAGIRYCWRTKQKEEERN